ncbi:CUB and sushi domain-containing protein 2 [Orchesella cincta]|uniref:CUB and sushi domain-containing protein 2 n=1 Tax=Orchesella cincta TaxID=48709 RepID=A0A1D2NCD4_ORCCI|nr:CUB and sushi domain-containing protein 2 [Orchesella cincta]
MVTSSAIVASNGSSYSNLLRSSPFSTIQRSRLNSFLGSDNVNEVPRLPVWNNAPIDNGPHMDFTQLFEMMGEPRGSQGRAMSELISRPKPKCNRRIRVLNGVTRIRERGSLARFQCSHGFMLIGPTTIVCLRDRWSEQPPICVRGGCRTLQTPANGVIRQSIGGAVAQFNCLGGSELIGESLLYCDGAKWNGSEPICYLEPTTTEKNEETSTEDLEVWPASVMTPAAASEQEIGADWDTNLEPVYSTTIISEQLPLDRNAFYGTSESPKVVTYYKTEVSTPIEVTTVVYPVPNESKPHMSEPPSVVEERLNSEISTSPPELMTFTTTSDRRSSDAFTSENKSSNTSVSVRITITVPPPPPLPTTSLPKILPIETTVPPKVVPVTTPPRKPKVPRRTRRPFPTRKPFKKPGKATARPPRKPQLPKEITQTFQRYTTPPVMATTERKNIAVPVFAGPDTAPSPLDYPIAIDKEPLSREHVEPIRPILPDMLNINTGLDGSGSNQHSKLAHASMIGGITLFIIGLTTFSAGVLLYCWRKNKGIARARPYDMDGRTLSAHDANDDFTWMEQRDSGL